MIQHKPTSVIVIGGGIIGLATSHYLRRAGFDVTVVEKGDFAAACSGGNCGYICPSHVLPLTEPGAIRIAIKSMLQPNAPFRVKPRADPALMKWMLQFARRCTHKQMLAAGVHLKAILDSSMDEYRKLMDAESLHCEWQESGLTYVLRSERAMESFAKTDALLTKHFGVAADRIDGHHLPAFDPALRSDLAGAFHYPCDAMLRPDRLSEQWTQRLRTAGVELVSNCEVAEVRHAGDRIDALVTSQGEMSATHYVLAVGAWSGPLAKQIGLRLPIEPGKGYSVTMVRPEPCPVHPMLFPEHKVGVTPFADGYRLGSMMEFAGFDETIPERRITQLKRSAEPYLRSPHTESETARWYGWRPMTWDSLPIIGPAPNLSNVTVATGHNMLGMSLATGTGKLVAEMLSGDDPHLDVSAFSPSRF